jgi:hypothetical protein
MVYNENDAIPMDGSFEVEAPSSLIPEGEYLFTIAQMKREQVEAKGKMPKHVNIKFMLRLENADGPAGTVWDNLRMYMKWAWKFAELAKSIGHTAADANSCRIDWSKFEGAQGRVKITQKDWEKNDGTKEKQNAFKYLLPVTEANGEQPF